MRLKLAMCLGLTVFGSAAAQELRPEEIYQRLLPSIVTLQVENRNGERYVGTGFLTLSNGLAATAWHVLADARKVTARFSDNEFADVLGLVDKDEKTDLALIRMAASPRSPVPLCTSNASIGSRAYVIGAPKGYDFSIGDGLISQIRMVEGVRQYQVSCPISGGNSGGPLVNTKGEVIGVVSWSKTDAQNLNFAVPAAALLRLDACSPLKPWTNPPNPGPGQDQPVQSPAKVFTSEADRLQFVQALRNAAGKEVTLVMEQAERKESFRFIVPADEPFFAKDALMDWAPGTTDIWPAGSRENRTGKIGAER